MFSINDMTLSYSFPQSSGSVQQKRRQNDQEPRWQMTSSKLFFSDTPGQMDILIPKDYGRRIAQDQLDKNSRKKEWRWDQILHLDK